MRTAHGSKPSKGLDREDVALGAAVAALRVQRGWSQRDLASHAGVNRVTVMYLERGEAVRLTTLRRISAALDVPMAMLLS